MPSATSIQNSLSAGEISPSLWGRTDLEKYHSGTTTCRNFFANYKGGVSSRAGLAYVGMCKQAYPAAPPRDIPFQFSISQGFALEFGDQYMRIKSNGAYITENNINVTSVSGAGLFTTSGAHGYSAGDWVFNTGNTGFSGLTWIVKTTPSGTTFTVTDLFGNVISAATASTTGTVSRLYTVVAPYAAVDLPYLKYAQSADTMTLTCVNQATSTAYAPYDLVRHSNTNWTFTQESFSASISAPSGLAATANGSTTANTYYSYVVTAISDTGEESVASTSVSIQNCDIAINEGSNVLSWTATPGASSYNVYGATPSYNAVVPVSVAYGFIGRSFGPGFVDTNIVPDFTQSPPTHNNPFAPGGIIGVTITAGGSTYVQATVGFTVTTATGSGFNGIPVVTSGAVTGFIVTNTGSGYKVGDTIAITGGAGATASLVIGPATGTYPSVVSYYQGRRVYANTLENPDTYFMSKPGLYNNFDSAIPVSPNDAIIGTPWAQQVNGIQFLVPMPGGLVVLTGKGAWQVNGGSQAAITPSTQTATPQAYNGCHSHVGPIPINYDILYIQAKGSIIRDLSYNFFVNIYTGTDLTVLSNHLFTNHQIQQWTWAEEPYKLVWLVRDDGTMLCLTYLKEQEVTSWTRHDTNGLFQGVCSITEPVNPNLTVFSPNLFDAVYVITQRYVRGAWRYYSERMNARIWDDSEDAYCVDAGLSYPQSFPNATISASAATGTGVSFTTDVAVFNSGMVGDIIRIGGGIATITQYNSTTQVIGTLTQPITAVVTDDSNTFPVPQSTGAWSISVPTSTVTNLNHLEGLTVTGLADGSVITPQVVTNGTITLQEPASQIVVGLPYVCQVQTVYLDHPAGPSTMQDRRKSISAVGVRVEATRGITVGSDQPDSSALENSPNIPWTDMNEVKDRSPTMFAGNATSLYTGDYYKTVTTGWDFQGQVAIQQSYPLPANILAVIAYWNLGDDK